MALWVPAGGPPRPPGRPSGAPPAAPRAVGAVGAQAEPATGGAQPPAPRPQDRGEVEAALAELDALVGLTQVKTLVRELAAYATVQGWRAAAGLRSDRLVLHMVFSGNPGTGKTTVARILGRLLRGLGLLSRGHLVEVERADLVGEYIGHTAAKARDALRRALGGVLFVDEAYSLARGGDRDFGREATDALVKGMEDHRHDLVLILAGYRAEMERFLRTNPGLRSRLALHLDFPDYTPEELLRIAECMLAARQYRLSPAARSRLAEMLRAPGAQPVLAAGNARLVRNALERALRRHAARLVRTYGGAPPAAPVLEELLPEDFEGSLRDLVGMGRPYPAWNVDPEGVVLRWPGGA
jgi:stage V sporulation protein K